LKGDGVVSLHSQWTPDLQQQGIPAVALPTDHLAVVRSAAGADKIAALVAHPQPRWSPAKVAQFRRFLEENPIERLLHSRNGSP